VLCCDFSAANIGGSTLVGIFGYTTDKAWKEYGEDDPYFGVLAHEEFSRNNLSDANLKRFFQSGEDSIAELSRSIEEAGLLLRTGRALDFGCGVGRLVIPLAARFREVVGVDVSEGMLRECAKNLAQRQLTNATLCGNIPEHEFDLVHSLLVFQHVGAKRGANLIEECWARVRPGGVLAIQIPIRFSGSRASWLLRRIRDVVPLLQIPYNIVRARRWNKPGMQMNIYDLNELAATLLQSGAMRIVLKRHDPDGSFCGVYLLAAKADPL
jgi:2-polyprenyl-3-methyl-5-hydroxy-6-metoxy-1,4-benzoquinol methylase